jgi:hypothetical protein
MCRRQFVTDEHDDALETEEEKPSREKMKTQYHHSDDDEVQ